PSLVFNNPSAPTTPAPVIAAVPRPAEAIPEPASRPALAAAVANAPAASGAEPRIVIHATAQVWVEVRDPAGKPVFMKLMRRGDSYGVPNRSGLTLSTGRASAIAMTVDGEPVEVQRRSFALNADELKQAAGTRRNGG